MALKRDFLDAAFSDLIREMYDWTCARCAKPFPERKGTDAHCSHFYGRGLGNAVRWNLDNACLLCASCHKHLGDRPDEHTVFFRRLIGDVRYEDLRIAKQQTVKLTKKDKQAMARHYREETRRIREARESGVTGYLSAAGW